MFWRWSSVRAVNWMPMPGLRDRPSRGGLIQITSPSHSIGSAKKGAPIYTGAAEVKGNSITALNDKLIRKGANVGRTFTVRFVTRDGQRVTTKMTLRAERKGDDAGKPLSS